MKWLTEHGTNLKGNVMTILVSALVLSSLAYFARPALKPVRVKARRK
jgi:hypothetical protein